MKPRSEVQNRRKFVCSLHHFLEFSQLYKKSHNYPTGTFSVILPTSYRMGVLHLRVWLASGEFARFHPWVTVATYSAGHKREWNTANHSVWIWFLSRAHACSVSIHLDDVVLDVAEGGAQSLEVGRHGEMRVHDEHVLMHREVCAELLPHRRQHQVRLQTRTPHSVDTRPHPETQR